MSIYNLRPYIGNFPLIGGYNLSPYIGGGATQRNFTTLDSAFSMHYTIPTLTLTGSFKYNFNFVGDGVSDFRPIGNTANFDNELKISPDGTTLSYKIGHGTFTAVTLNTPLDVNKLNNIIFQRDGSNNVTIINNGVLDGHSTVHANAFVINVLARASTQYTSGVLSDVKIYDNGTLVRDYPIDETWIGPSTVLNDRSGNNQHGTAVNIDADDSEPFTQDGIDWLSGEKWTFEDYVSTGSEGIFSQLLQEDTLLIGSNYTATLTISGLTTGQFRYRNLGYEIIESNDGIYNTTFIAGSTSHSIWSGNSQPNVGAVLGVTVKRVIEVAPILVPLQLDAVAWYNFRDSSKLIGGAVPTIDVAGWKDSSVSNVEISSDLVTNGDFNTNLSGWTVQNTDANNTITWDSGAVHIVSDSTTATSLRLRQNAFVSNSYNKIKFDVVEATGSNNLRLQNSGNILVDNIPNIIGSYEYIVYTTSTDLRFTNDSRTDVNIKLDNVEVYELDPATVAYDLSQATASKQPTFTQPNGPVVFDGNVYLDGMPIQSGDFTYFLNLKTSDTVNIKSVFLTPTNNEMLIIDAVNGNLKFRTITSGFDDLISLNLADNTDKIIGLTKSGNDYTAYLNGSTQLSVTKTGDFHISRLAARAGGTLGFIGDINEVICFDRALNSTEIDQINTWMNR